MSLQIQKFGQFQLLKQIARGGMAEIYLACSGNVESAYKFVAIKRILLAHSKNVEFNKMFQNEGKIAVNLNHSNVCSIYEFGIEKDQYFICMEYISGRNLRQLTKKLRSWKKNLDIATCAYILKHACNGLDYAHNCTDSVTGQPLNIIHRDVSPQNIMISFNGDVKVIDFGIAKIDDSESTRAGVLKGKFEYMSPEQVKGQDLDRQTDIFSLGNVLWELLARRKLFVGDNEIQLLKKIRDCKVPDLKKLNPSVPDQLVEIINKALNVNKNLRYKTSAEMGNDIALFLNKFYPDFTQARFSSFIKEVYVEEILEERQNLKIYLQELSSKQSGKKRGRLTSSSASYSAKEKSTFIGHSGDISGLSEAEETGEEEESTFTKHTVTQTQQDTYTESEDAARTQGDLTRTQQETVQTENRREITKTEFEDSLDSGEVSLSTQSRVIRSDGFRNIITTKNGKDKKTIAEYKPWKAGVNVYKSRSVKNSSTRRRRSSVFIRALIMLFVCGTAGYLYFFESERLMSFVGSGKLIHQSEESSFTSSEGKQAVESAGSAELRDPAAVSNRREQNKADFKESSMIGQTAYGKSVFIVTKPSGAQVYIDDKKISRLTPTSVLVPLNREFTLTIRRRGYRDRTAVLSPDRVKPAMDFNLERKKGEIRNETVIIR